MKRNTVLIVLIVLFLMCTNAGAQEQPGAGPTNGQAPEAFRLVVMAPQQPGQRGGAGGAGAANGQGLEAVRLPVMVMQQPGQRGGARGAGPVDLTAGTAWWTNAALVERLGLTAQQKTRIESAFENHRYNLVLSKESLQKEEALLNRLLEAETIDRNAVLSQTNRVIQARGDVERENAAMTTEMRETLTRAQWMQLQPQAGVRIGAAPAQANLQTSVAPAYPALARAARIQETVTLEVTIDKEGKVVSAAVVKGHPLLNEAAIEAVKQWRYKPFLLNGQPTTAITTINLTFPPQQ